MQITEQNVRELEQHHGTGIIVLSVGDQDFAFRRPTETEVSYALAAQAKGSVNFLEDLALGCLLSIEAPRAGTPARIDSEGRPVPRSVNASSEEKSILTAEKERLEAMWADAQEFRESLPALFSLSCGGNPSVDSTHLGGDRYEVSVKSNPMVDDSIEPWSFMVTAARPSGPQFDEYRKRESLGDEGDSQRYLWDRLVDAPNKNELSRLYPFAVIAAGKELARLGVNGRSVRVKKFGSGQAPEPGTSGNTLPAAAISG